MLLWLYGTDNDEGRAERELRARDDGALLARRGPRRYTERDVREQARALTGWRNDWSDELGPATSASTRRGTTPARRRSSASAATSTGRTRAGSASTTRCTPRSSSTKLWSYFVPTPPDGGDAARARAALRRRGYEIRPGRRGDPAAPGLYNGPAHGQAAGRLHRRAAARARPRDRHRRPGRGSRARPASSSSTRRTSPAGTTRAGSTPRPSAARWDIAELRARADACSNGDRGKHAPDDADEAASTAARRLLGQARRSRADDARRAARVRPARARATRTPAGRRSRTRR